MKKIILLIMLIPCIIYSQTKERFINPSTLSNNTKQQNIITNIVIETNIVTNQDSVVSQEIIQFIQEREQRNEQKRQENAISNKPEKDEEDIFMIPEQNYKFAAIDAIVLDAGHGGKDPGGVSNGIEEKRLVLTLVKKIHALFRKQNRNIKVYVTRKNDTFIPLEERVSKTARWSVRKNILFVSIHGNIAYNPKISGFEIYTLSDKASDSDALATERIENAGFSPEDIQQTDSVYSILADLIRDSTRKQSEWLAQYVYDDSLQSTQGYGRGLKRANFFVLKYNTVPSILVEVGYMSNKYEASKLQDEEYQNLLAIGIFKGISRYIDAYNQSEGFVK
ncbi:MAG: N-acetylmuramoyl-L-alanine amidase family protein [Brevinema sp.]